MLDKNTVEVLVNKARVDFYNDLVKAKAVLDKAKAKAKADFYKAELKADADFYKAKADLWLRL